MPYLLFSPIIRCLRFAVPLTRIPHFLPCRFCYGFILSFFRCLSNKQIMKQANNNSNLEIVSIAEEILFLYFCLSPAFPSFFCGWNRILWKDCGSDEKGFREDFNVTQSTNFPFTPIFASKTFLSLLRI